MWLIIEWPEGAEAPTDYWLSNLPGDERRERLARLARLRWTIELDYRQLKGELGLDHYEGRSYLGFYHHCALVTCAHAFLTLERLDPKRGGRPDTAADGAAPAARPALLGRPLSHLSAACRSQPARTLLTP
jgi:SRSO17 transposase